MKITLQRQNDAYHFTAFYADGASLLLDASPAIGGENKGFRPMESLLAGLGGCAAIDLLSILKKQRQTIDDVTIDITATRRTQPLPAIFETIQVVFHLTGDIDPARIDKALPLVADKYCSVYHILRPTADIQLSYTLQATPETTTDFRQIPESETAFETLAIRTQTPRTAFNEHSAPLYMTSSFVFDDAEAAAQAFAGEGTPYIYSRFSNPNTTELVDKMCQLEGTEAGHATASGMSAIFASMAAFLRQGDHLVACRSVFGNSHRIITGILPKWGVEYTYVDINDPDSWEAAIQPNTKMLFAETPSNPALDFIDLQWLGQLCRKHSILLNIDNCFATPFLQQPARYGADLVTHSATKWIDGQGRVLGGLVLGREALIKEVYAFARRTGPAISPFNAWVLSKSLETLSVRMQRHCENALYIARHLEGHPAIESVKYPFLPSHPQYELAQRQMRMGGGLFTCIVKGGMERGQRFLNALQMLSLTANLGDTRTIATHPASTPHSNLTPQERQDAGIWDGLLRFSVGLEHPKDVLADIEQALEKSK